MAHRIVHFEIPSDNNIERANKFYNDLFGWKMEKVPGSDGILDVCQRRQ
jgi:predicted enzyme related to lactoylglutathione lyase